MRQSGMKRFTLAAALAAGAFAFGSGSQALAQSAELVEAAKKEGKVVWYTTIIIDQAARPMAEAFMKKYPEITVEFSRAGSGETALKIINEANAGQTKADVFDGSATFSNIGAAGLVENYKAENAKDYEFVDPDGGWTSILNYYLSVGINTDLVKDEDAPKTFEDLLDPKWKGKMAWSIVPEPTGAPGFIGNVLEVMGEEKGMAYLEKLAEQDITNITASQRVVADRVIVGDFPVGLMIFNHHSVISAAKGAPLKTVNLEPFVGSGSLMGLVKNGPHPNAGKLFVEFVLSEEGQKVIAGADYIPAHPNVSASDPILKPDTGNFKVNFMTPAKTDADLQKWISILNDLFT